MIRLLACGRRWPCLAAAALALAAGGCRSRPPAPTPVSATPPNVVLITFDTLRPDFLGCYGASDAHTPHFDALAARATRFDRAFTAVPFTPPALWSLLFSVQVRNFTYDTSLRRTYPGAVSIAERFRQAGYFTAGVVGSAILNRGSGFERGFDEYRDTSAAASIDNDAALERVLELREGRLEAERRKGRPYFLFVHFFNPHTPWAVAPAPFRPVQPEPSRFSALLRRRRPALERIAPLTDSLRADGRDDVATAIKAGRLEEMLRPAYRAEIQWCDSTLGRLLERLEGPGTILAVASDHGIAFAEHYQTSGYVFSLYDEVARVPLLISGSPRLGPPGVVRAPVSLVDLGPTLLELSGLGDTHQGGRSLVPAIHGRPARPVYAEAVELPRRFLAAFHANPGRRYAPGLVNTHRMVVAGDYKLIWMPAKRGAPYELYDLAHDPAESDDVYARPGAPRDALLAELSRRGGRARPSVPSNEENTESLRALGYIQ